MQLLTWHNSHTPPKKKGCRPTNWQSTWWHAMQMSSISHNPAVTSSSCRTEGGHKHRKCLSSPESNQKIYFKACHIISYSFSSFLCNKGLGNIFHKTIQYSYCIIQRLYIPFGPQSFRAAELESEKLMSSSKDISCIFINLRTVRGDMFFSATVMQS